MEKLFKQACKIHTQFMVARYLMANSEGRLDGAEKAQRHIELCEFYAALAFGWSDPDSVQGSVDGAIELFQKIHYETAEKLTDRMDEVIGFPVTGRPNYGKLGSLFFDAFHDVAIKSIGNQESA